MNENSQNDFDSIEYFRRIGISRDVCDVSFQSLASILLAHMQVIPFENLDVVINKTISMNLSDVMHKLVTKQRGGYCFEHNILLAAALKSIGYSVTPILARVLWNKLDIPSPQHVVLVVTMGGGSAGGGEKKKEEKKKEEEVEEYLVDAAFGGLGSIAPLRMNTEDPQQTDALYRIIQSPNNHQTVQIFVSTRNNWVSMFTYRYEPASVNDMNLSNWWCCTHAEARWKTCLFVARVIGDDRHCIFNSEYRIRSGKDGSAAVSTIGSVAELLDLVSDVFGIHVGVESFPDQLLLAQSCQHFLDSPKE